MDLCTYPPAKRARIACAGGTRVPLGEFARRRLHGLALWARFALRSASGQADRFESGRGRLRVLPERPMSSQRAGDLSDTRLRTVRELPGGVTAAATPGMPAEDILAREVLASISDGLVALDND